MFDGVYDDLQFFYISGFEQQQYPAPLGSLYSVMQSDGNSFADNSSWKALK